MSTIAVLALMQASGMDFNEAKRIIANLEDAGLTIYRKKIHKNSRGRKVTGPIVLDEGNDDA